ncbi:MAG TPA: DUF3891 family protein [Tepidisphaeraceae bacterium]|nr:DUF3891 family protein [Tepidisphaeraceae bacterium]
MIRRDTSASLMLITQYDHSRLSGELARQMGNGLFSPPLPFEPTIIAIAEHDCGWVIQDRRPDLNTRGWPAHVFEADSTTALDAWGASVDQVVGRHPYAGLLVSLHTMALANRASLRQPEATDEFSRQQTFRLRRFVHRQIELQESLRIQLGMRTDLPLRGGLAEQGRSPEEDLLRVSFFLLEFFDQLSLNLCFDQLVFGRIEMVYPRPGEGPIGLRISREAGGEMRLDPWPFNRQRLELTVPARCIRAESYRDADALKSACDAAELFNARVILCA